MNNLIFIAYIFSFLKQFFFPSSQSFIFYLISLCWNPRDSFWFQLFSLVCEKRKIMVWLKGKSFTVAQKRWITLLLSLCLLFFQLQCQKCFHFYLFISNIIPSLPCYTVFDFHLEFEIDVEHLSDYWLCIKCSLMAEKLMLCLQKLSQSSIQPRFFLLCAWMNWLTDELDLSPLHSSDDAKQCGNLLKVKCSRLSGFPFIIIISFSSWYEKKETHKLPQITHWIHHQDEREKESSNGMRRWISIQHALWTFHESFMPLLG